MKSLLPFRGLHCGQPECGASCCCCCCCHSTDCPRDHTPIRLHLPASLTPPNPLTTYYLTCSLPLSFLLHSPPSPVLPYLPPFRSFPLYLPPSTLFTCLLDTPLPASHLFSLNSLVSHTTEAGHGMEILKREKWSFIAVPARKVLEVEVLKGVKKKGNVINISNERKWWCG